MLVGMKTTLAERLRTALKHAGLNQKQLEESAGLSLGYMSRVLRGQRERIDAARIDKIARVCGVDFEWLSTAKGAMVPRRAGDEEVGHDVMVTTTSTDEPNPLEDALAVAFRQGHFALTDLDAVRGLVRNGAALLRDKEHLVDAARSWLHAAAALRKANTPVTFATLAWQVTALGSQRVSQAYATRDEALNREAEQELRALGADAPREAVKVPRKH
jgi:transcriptional regulator with XRE-family HTH domain